MMLLMTSPPRAGYPQQVSLSGLPLVLSREELAVGRRQGAPHARSTAPLLPALQLCCSPLTLQRASKHARPPLLISFAQLG